MIEVGPEHVVEVLHALGATMVAEKRSEADILVGYEVSPPIDLSSYDAELAAFRKTALVAHLKARRWQAETAGITATIGGEAVRVSTTRGDDRAALHQVCTAISGGLRSDGAVFNFADGVSRGVSNAEMQAVVLAALAHVQACFDLEGTLRAAIEAGILTTKEEIDAASWPADVT
ncbi:DUF4376 domain-containing protein [Bosea sp. (in: a-proteobacteria)]|uniref:DUF4376 domain-containing protein n=1 Tax=Bosea sp. (in: a-proteobacteria) TaxID=1871050 RepID=UPI0031FF1F9F